MGGRVTSVELIGAAGRRLRREGSDLANTVSPYRALALSGRAPGRLAAAPHKLGKGDAAQGAALLAGRFTLAGETLEVEPGPELWDRPAPSRRHAAALHGFGWLADLLAAPDREAAHEAARAACDGWIDQFGRWNWFAWSPALTARRTINWLMAAPALLADDDPGAPARLKALARHARRLRRALPLMEDGRDKLTAAYALALAGVAMELPPRLASAGNAALAGVLKRQILPDGGHIGRCPETAAAILVDLAVLEEAAQRRGAALDPEITRAVDRLAPMVRFFQLGKRGLAGFHGGGEGDALATAKALKAVDAPKAAFVFAPHSGYHRLESDGSVVIVDAGGPPPGPHAKDSHASATAFEFASGPDRVVVNCGWTVGQLDSWREPVRATAAHSALCLEETSLARLLGEGWRRGLLGPRIAQGPEPVRARRNQDDAGVWLEMSHDGYRREFGLCVRRRIFLASDGADLRGEDALFRAVEDGEPDTKQPRAFAIRFHLHPDVKASLARDRMSALLALPGGAGWRFRTDAGPVALERSVYLSSGAPPRRTSQLVVAGEAESYGGGDQPPNRVRWAFQRLDGREGTEQA